MLSFVDMRTKRRNPPAFEVYKLNDNHFGGERVAAATSLEQAQRKASEFHSGRHRSRAFYVAADRATGKVYAADGTEMSRTAEKLGLFPVESLSPVAAAGIGALAGIALVFVTMNIAKD